MRRLKDLVVGQEFSFDFDGGIEANWIYKVIAVGKTILVKEVQCPITFNMNSKVHDVLELSGRSVSLRTMQQAC